MTVCAALPAGGPCVSDVKRIAVLRANAVGDFVLTLPALNALRETYPGARITLLGRRWHADFMAGRDGPVDEVIQVPDFPGVSTPPDGNNDVAGWRDFKEQMHRTKFDLALQLHGGGRYSNPFVLQLGARITAGFQAPDAPALDRNFPYIEQEADNHPRALLLLECVGLVGATTAQIEPRLQLRQSDADELTAVLPGLQEPIAVLQPGANDPRRRWSLKRFAEVGDALSELGARVIVHGGPDETSLVQRVCQGMRHPAIAAAGVLSVGGLAALLSRSRILVSNDTGPAHLARALGIPTVTIYWIGNLCSYGPLSARHNRVFASYRIHCPVCSASCIGYNCGHTASFVDDVGTQDVLDAVEELYHESGTFHGREASAMAATARAHDQEANAS